MPLSVLMTYFFTVFFSFFVCVCILYLCTSTTVQQRMLDLFFCQGDVRSVQQRVQKLKVNHGQRVNVLSCTEASTALWA